ncbi:MAG TPA: alpha/beta hydrolase fold domain-containing protein [Gemmatimonadaceae bacterium]|nr:alpha/beta hydrolase fold domain-containing protein [Gemmatimonadaceae bacterium]
MQSLRSRIFNAAVRLMFRRRDWGDEQRLTRRARRLVGAPRHYGVWRSIGLKVEQVKAPVRGEWILPPKPRPGAILYIHGGGFISGSPARHRPISAGLARRTRMPVFSVDYPLAPEHHFPRGLEEVVRALDWLRGLMPENEKIAVVGDSAGGGLTLSLLLKTRDARSKLPACAAMFSPWLDLSGMTEPGRANAKTCVMFHPENGTQFSAAYLGGADARDPLASPLHAKLHGLPPVLFQASSTELLLDDSRRASHYITEAGGKSTLQIYDGVMHCWQMLDRLVPEAGKALDEASRFILLHTQMPAAVASATARR